MSVEKVVAAMEAVMAEHWEIRVPAPDCLEDMARAAIAAIEQREALLAERDKLAVENARLRAGLQGMLEIQDTLDECGSCENEFINPRVSAARAALKDSKAGLAEGKCLTAQNTQPAVAPPSAPTSSGPAPSS